eukprot:CAMPEP_0178966242 /NCGR_PEP_ID=MMETSP0789-20121207/16805_1 /TAXON_ID=3005 /ORGANISM="Rhizosolenia setigera, Strain CCMP 1694" /LENGTH=233 /DNA_ID=CAMNT_0020651469 /DNA_START=203 /DNA_END=901 /DNA_ORIENTATION=-
MSETNNNIDSNNKRKRSDDDHEDLPKTVKLNVGGKHFEVSRRLITKDSSKKDNFLSRLVSDTWHKDPESEIFIDRDGDRFTHVLDYLRYGEVMLPKTISMDAFMKDMDFYGIAVRYKNSVRRENNAVEILHEVKSQFRIKRRKFEIEKKKFEKLENEFKSAEDECQKEHKHFLLATSFMKYYESSATIIYYISSYPITSNKIVVDDEIYSLEDYEENLLQKYLNGFGLEFTGW